MKVAWLGLGQMGLPSAKKVAAAGHEVRGYDVRPPERGNEGGIRMVATPREAIEGAQLICIAVFDDKQVEDLLLGADGMLAGLPPDTIVAIFTTGSIESAQKLAALAPADVAVLDTCFSRSFAERESGMLSLLIGGEAAAIERARPVFDAFARTIIHVGSSGSGRAIKLVNNIAYAAHLQLVSDALRFAEALGLDPVQAAQAITHCSGSSEVFARASLGDFTRLMEGAHPYMVKDVSAAADAAASRGASLGSLGAVTEVYRK